VLPEFEGSRNVAIHALYPSKQFLPAKVRLFIDYLVGLYSPTPPWDQRITVGIETAASANGARRRTMAMDPAPRGNGDQPQRPSRRG
jgi:hypothetical protein